MTLDHCRAGAGQLRIEMSSGLSAAVSVRASSPLKILIPRPRGPSVWACLSSFGGGLVAGDEISVTLSLGEQARCCLSTQASTKVYRNPGARPCSHHLQAQLGRGSFLAVIPDPVQAFLGSRYRQQQEFSLAPESGLVLVDWLCSGRTARGERWAFHRFQSRNEVVLEDSRVLLDSLMLDPADGSLGDTYRLGRFNCLALVLVLGESLQAASARVLEDFSHRRVPRHASLVSSASPIAHGALVRLAGQSAEAVRQEIRRLLGLVPEVLQDDPWSRKW